MTVVADGGSTGLTPLSSTLVRGRERGHLFGLGRKKPPSPKLSPRTILKRRLIAITTIALLAVCSFARAADDWLLTTIDFQTRRAELKSFDDKQLQFAGDQPAVAIDKLLQIRRATTSAPPAANTWMANLAGGDRVVGKPVSTSGEIITWHSQPLGDVKLSMRALTSIERTGPMKRPANKNEPPRTEDVVQLANGDAVRGIVSDLSASSVTIQPAAGDPTTLPVDSVIAVYFAAAPSATASQSKRQSRSFQLILSDSSIISCDGPRLNNGQVQASKLLGVQAGDVQAGDAVSIPLGDVYSIEQVNGPVVWLSNVPPTEDIQTSFLDLNWPTKFDRTVDGSPIRLPDRAVARGIGVHAYSRLMFPIDGVTLTTFRTQYAIDGNASASPLADVTVRIKLDGKVVHEQAHWRAGAVSPVVSLPLDSAKSITLEVDYGDNQDVQDRFLWIEPALLR